MAELELPTDTIILVTAGEIAVSNPLGQREVLRRSEAAFVAADAKTFTLAGSGTAFTGVFPAGFGYREGETVNFGTIGSYNWFDLTLRFNVNDNLTLTAAVQNLLDKDPPVVGSSIGSTSFNSGNTYPSTYDALGRRFAVSARVKF